MQPLASLLGIQLARARVLPAGIVVIHTLASRLGTATVQIAPSGIRTGLLLQAFAELQQKSTAL